VLLVGGGFGVRLGVEARSTGRGVGRSVGLGCRTGRGRAGVCDGAAGAAGSPAGFCGTAAGRVATRCGRGAPRSTEKDEPAATRAALGRVGVPPNNQTGAPIEPNRTVERAAILSHRRKSGLMNLPPSPDKYTEI
jgi:hypothetical protein